MLLDKELRHPLRNRSVQMLLSLVPPESHPPYLRVASTFSMFGSMPLCTVIHIQDQHTTYHIISSAHRRHGFIRLRYPSYRIPFGATTCTQFVTLHTLISKRPLHTDSLLMQISHLILLMSDPIKSSSIARHATGSCYCASAPRAS